MAAAKRTESGFLRRGRRPRRPLHVKAYPIGKDRRFRRLYEFADPFFLFIPNAAGRGQAAAPTAKTGVRCEYLWRRQNPTRRRRDPSSVSVPQDDAPSGSGLRAARNHLPRRGRQGRPTPAGRADALGGPIRLPGHSKVDRRREVYERKGGRPMVGPTGARSSACTIKIRSPRLKERMRGNRLHLVFPRDAKLVL